MKGMLDNRGDTLIEVMFAIAVFSLVAVGAISIMNQGADTAQRALEIALVRQQIDAQAETLRFLNASYIAAYEAGGTYSASPYAEQWQSIQGHLSSSVVASSTSATCAMAKDITNSFILNTHTAEFASQGSGGLTFEPADTFSQVNYNNNTAYGIWIQGVSPGQFSGDQSSSTYIDFHINACWYSPGQSMPVTIGTIVRLYEPV
jgi:prepilin-type N-terminal cleavage/methylation domain-containing protein